MAPPSSRRPGFSRKAQYGLFLGYVAAVAGIVLAVLLLIAARFDPAGFNALRGAALDVTAPVSGAGRSVVRSIASSIADVGNYFQAASQNAELKRQLDATRNRLVEAQVLEQENKRLRRLLGLTRSVDDRLATGRVVGSTFDSNRRLATIDVGAADGVRIGQPVRAAEGLLGRVIETGRNAARVLLVTDGGSNVPVRLVRGGIPALATGRGDGTMDIKPLELGESPFKRGDLVMTSGVGGIFPPGIPVAVVVATQRDTTIARPLADPGQVDYAIVQRLYQPAANQPLDPPPAPPLPALAPAEAP